MNRFSWAKISCFLLLLAGLSLAFWQHYVADKNTRLDNLPEHYFQMARYLRSIDQQLPGDNTIFLGDSHIQNLCVPCVQPGAVNFGIGHDTTVGLLHRLKDYQSLAHAQQVLITIGTNDLKRRNNAAIISNYRELFTKLPTGVNIYWLAIPPTDHTYAHFHGRQNQRITQLNQGAQTLCRQRPHCRFINPTQALTDRNGNLRSNYHRGDGLHLNAPGYQQLIELLRDHIAPTHP